MNQLIQVGLGLLGGYVAYRAWSKRQEEKAVEQLEGIGVTPPMLPNRGYSRSVSKTPRKAATGKCVFGSGSTCRFPYGDAYHARKALQYVQAGRCAAGECEKVLSALARGAPDAEVRRRAKNERRKILQSAYRAKRRRAKTRRSR